MTSLGNAKPIGRWSIWREEVSHLENYYKSGFYFTDFRGWNSRLSEFFSLQNRNFVLTEGSSVGEINWEVDWSDIGLKISSVLVTFQHATFENGSVEWQLCAGDQCFVGNKGNMITVSFSFV